MQTQLAVLFRTQLSSPRRAAELLEPQRVYLIIAEIHQAINKLGGSAQPATPDEVQRTLRHLGADIDLLSIVDSWQDTLRDEDILQLLKNWNAGRPLFQTVYLSVPEVDK
jgi:hypothetical protein